MKKLIGCGLILISSMTQAADSLYCPTHSAQINIGMTSAQVISACGEPKSKKTSNQPMTQKVPMTQLMYNTVLSSGAFTTYSNLANTYHTYNLPTNQGSVSYEIDIINNKVSAIKMNGAGTNALSICGGMAIQKGDPVAKVYNSCGSPNIVNNSYNDETIQSENPPEIWTYQFTPYQAPVNITIVEGILRAIN